MHIVCRFAWLTEGVIFVLKAPHAGNLTSFLFSRLCPNSILHTCTAAKRRGCVFLYSLACVLRLHKTSMQQQPEPALRTAVMPLVLQAQLCDHGHRYNQSNFWMEQHSQCLIWTTPYTTQQQLRTRVGLSVGAKPGLVHVLSQRGT